MFNKVFQFFLHLYNLFHCDRLTTDSLFQGLDMVFRKKIDIMEKVALTRDEFYEMVWTTPTSHLLKKYDITQHKFIGLCKKFDIPRPGIGYWIKKANNKPVIRKALPISNKSGSSIELYVKSEKEKGSSSEVGSQLVTSKKSDEKGFRYPEKLKNPHPMILETKRCWEDSKAKGYNRDRNIPHLSIRVEPPHVKRALLLMDTFVKLLEKRGHRIEFKYHRPYAVLYDVDIELDLREAAKRIPKPDAYPTFELEYTGQFVLMTGKYSIHKEWRDGKIKLEGMLEKIVDWMETHAREWADWREQSRLKELERAKEKEQHEKMLARQQQEIQSFKTLLEGSKKHQEANVLREYITAARAKAIAEKKFDKALEAWVTWAAKKADWLDPLTNSPDDIMDEKL